MEITKGNIRLQLEQLDQLVQKSRFLLAESHREEFTRELKKLTEQIRKIEEPVLNVGILGGTGVGKSTIINALANDQISSVSDRRPHTDLVIVYRHKESSLPPDIPGDYIREPHNVHENDLIAGLIIYDFPDFDSIVKEHAEKVLALLEFLDIAIWVVSPEKYADLEFYKVLSQTSKHQDNFIFVMNKIDTIKAPGSDPQHELKTLLGDFTLKLKRNGILSPKIYSFSAREINNTNAPEWWKEDFFNFKNSLFRKRDIKEILAIKEANIEAEVNRIVKELKALYVRYNNLPVELNGIMLDFQKEFQDLKDLTEIITGQFITEKTIDTLKQRVHQNEADVAPVAFFKRLWSKTLRRTSSPGDNTGWESSLSENDSRFNPVRNKFKSLLYRINTILLRYGIDVARKQITELERSIDYELNQFVSKSRETFLEFLETVPGAESSFIKFITRIKQWFFLGIPAIFLLVSLIGPKALKEFQASPSLGKAFSLLFNILLSLYTSSGLISLLSFLVIETIVIIFLASRSIKRDEQRLTREIEAFNKYLANRLTKHLETLKTKIEEKIDNIIKEAKNADKLLEQLEYLHYEQNL